MLQRTQQLIRHVPNEYFIHKPSKAEFVREGKNVKVLLDNKWGLPLDRRSNVVGQLNLGMDERLLIEEFKEGRYFIVDDKIVDHRTKNALKFEHTTDSINQLVDYLGFSRLGESNVAVARSVTSNMDVDILKSKIGGEFNVKVGFGWSPFELDISSYVSLLRMVCSNGMVAMSPIMNNTIPMMNQWRENIEISNDVLVHQFNKKMLPRLEAMPNERVSMFDVLTMRALVNDLQQSAHLDKAQTEGLEGIYEKLDGLVDSEVLSIKKNMLQFIPAPISAYDAMNVATECATHYVGEDRNSNRAQAFANHLIFNEDRGRKLDVDLSGLVVDTQTFMDADRAFFGTTCH